MDNDPFQKENILNNCDLFEIPINFSYKGKYYYKTKFGGILSILDILIIILYLLLNFEEIFGKNNYTLLYRESDSINNIINFTNVPFAFKLTYANETDVDYNSNLFSYKLVKVTSNRYIDENGIVKIIYNESNIEFEACQKYLHNNLYNNLIKYNSANLMCIKLDQNIYMKGSIDNAINNDVVGFRIYINKNNDKILMNEIKFNFYFLGYSLNHLKDFYGIVKNKLYSYSFDLSKYYIKKYYFNFKSVTYTYYDGIKKNTKNFFMHNGYFLDIEERKDNNENLLAYFSFNSNGINIEYTKKLENVWNLIDRIGGISYVIITISQIINNYISRKILCIDMNKSFEMNDNLSNVNSLNFKAFENMKSSDANLVKKNKTKVSAVMLDSIDKMNKEKSKFLSPNKLTVIKKNVDINNNIGHKNNMKFGSYVIKFKGNIFGNNLMKKKKKEKKDISKMDKYIFYLLPNFILEKSKKYGYFLRLEKNICQLCSIDNFIKIASMDKLRKSNGLDNYNPYSPVNSNIIA